MLPISPTGRLLLGHHWLAAGTLPCYKVTSGFPLAINYYLVQPTLEGEIPIKRTNKGSVCKLEHNFGQCFTATPWVLCDPPPILPTKTSWIISTLGHQLS